MEYTTKQQVLALIREQIRAHGNQKKFAQALSMQESYLSDILKERRNPCRAILDFLQLEPEIVYRVKGEKK